MHGYIYANTHTLPNEYIHTNPDTYVHANANLRRGKLVRYMHERKYAYVSISQYANGCMKEEQTSCITLKRK